MLEDIKSNVVRLIALYESEKKRADELETRLEKSEETVRNYFEQITELNSQIDNLKLSAAFGAATDTAMAKARIEKLVAEIDKCIRLLER